MMTTIPSLPLHRRLGLFPGLILGAALTAAVLSGCGGGGAALPTATTPVIDSLAVNGVPVAFSGAAVPVFAVPTNSLSSLVCTAHDPDHSPLTFAWSGINGTVTSQSGAGTATNTPTQDGDTLVTCTVTNARGASDSRTLTLRAGTTTPTTLAVAVSPASAIVAAGQTDLVTALVTGSAPFTYHFSIVSGTGTVVQSTANPAQATFTAPAVAETDTVLCYVTDGQGHAATATTTILVQ